MAGLNMALPHLMLSDSRSCARCGSRFNTFGREYICPECRKPRACQRRPRERRQLSNREQQIVDLICRGKTNKEIAYELCLTEGTVKEYLHHIFRKLNVTNRTELAVSRFDAAQTQQPTQALKRVI